MTSKPYVYRYLTFALKFTPDHGAWVSQTLPICEVRSFQVEIHLLTIA